MGSHLLREDRSRGDDKLLWSSRASGMDIRIYMSAETGETCVHHKGLDGSWACHKDIERRLAVLEMALLEARYDQSVQHVGIQ